MKPKPAKRRMKVRKIAPSLRGVSEAAGLMAAGKLVFMPTESVYMACTTIQPSQFLSPSAQFMQFLYPRSNEIEPAYLLIMPKPVSTLNRLACWGQKRPYAIRQLEYKTANTPVVVFSEAKEVFRRLSNKLWPGPVIVYVKTENESLLPLTSKKNSCSYLAISNPLHPLAKRIVQETYASTKLRDTNRVLVGSLSCGSTKRNAYITKAAEVSRRVSSKFTLSEDKYIHVINGEETSEQFSVPTCQYGKPCTSSLWINESSRTLYIRGQRCFDDEAKDANLNEDALRKTLVFPSSSRAKNDRQKYTDRVISAVLFKWKVVDQRSN